MSAPQLDILALEPFFGGARRAMLETLVRCSRHRWTLLKLPPRRIERRLSVAANWFGEQLTRHWVGRVDLLFTSEAMNLANLFQLLPALTDKPSVVYFHENQLPDVNTNTDAPLDLVNLNTADAATEIWFNSEWHRRTFFARVKALVDRHRELSADDPVSKLKRKSSVMPPPIDWSAVTEAMGAKVERDGTALFVETRDAEVGLLKKALSILRGRKEKFRLITVGPLDGLVANGDGVAGRSVSETDEAGQARGLCEAGVFVSVKPEAASDRFVVRGLAAGCRPVLPASGFYPELLPPALQRSCLYEPSPVDLANHLQAAISPFQTATRKDELRNTLAPFDPAAACRRFDERFEELVWVRAVD
jgi:hypothetical protein